MPRYRYTKLTVSCGTPRHFAADRLREAVEHLQTVRTPMIPQGTLERRGSVVFDELRKPR